MAAITQDMRYRLSLIKYAEKFCVTKAVFLTWTASDIFVRFMGSGNMRSCRLATPKMMWI